MLDNSHIEELHKLLVDIYFTGNEKLGREEKEYTEDLIFELFAKNQLEEKYAETFSNLMTSDKSLHKRYYILKNLVNPRPAEDEKSRTLTAEKTEEQEEEELKSVLLEVLEQAHAGEKAPSPGLLDQLKSFFGRLLEPFIIIQPQQNARLSPAYVLRPQVKVALALTSMAGLAVIIWFSIAKKPEILTAENTVTDTTLNQQIIGIDSSRQEPGPAIIELIDPGKLLEEQMAQNDQKGKEEVIRINETEPPQLAQNTEVTEEQEDVFNGLLATMYTPPGFEYNLARGEISDAAELFVRAADLYNGEYGPKDYYGSIAIFRKLMDDNAFSNPDTLNEIYYFLGNSYLAIGIDTGNRELLQKALTEFGSIVKDNKYYLPSKWYAAMAYLKLGNAPESFRLCDSLVQVNYSRMGAVEMMRDSLYRRINQ